MANHLWSPAGQRNGAQAMGGWSGLNTLIRIIASTGARKAMIAATLLIVMLGSATVLWQAGTGCMCAR
jgi:hypothetical protein